MCSYAPRAVADAGVQLCSITLSSAVRLGNTVAGLCYGSDDFGQAAESKRPGVVFRRAWLCDALSGCAARSTSAGVELGRAPPACGRLHGMGDQASRRGTNQTCVSSTPHNRLVPDRDLALSS